MGETLHGNIEYADGGDQFRTPAAMLVMAQSLEPGVLDRYANKTARNNATSHMTGAGKYVECFVDGNVGKCAYTGAAWVNLDPPKRYRHFRGYGILGPVADPGQTYTDPVTLSITGLVAGQAMDIITQATIAIDPTNGVSSFQTVQLQAAITNATTVTSSPRPRRIQPPPYAGPLEVAPLEDRYIQHESFTASGGTSVISARISAGTATAQRLVLIDANIWVDVYPVSAA
jgi:hypothetical protein